MATNNIKALNKNDDNYSHNNYDLYDYLANDGEFDHENLQANLYSKAQIRQRIEEKLEHKKIREMVDTLYGSYF